MAPASQLVSGLEFLQEITEGDASVRVAILDGPVDLSHPIFRKSNVESFSIGELSTGKLCGMGRKLPVLSLVV